MKFERKQPPFEPVIITLESEVEFKVMRAILSETVGHLAGAVAGVSKDEIIEAFNKNNDDTAYTKLNHLRR